MQKLNPFSVTARANEIGACAERQKARTAALKHMRSKAGRAEKAARTTRQNQLNDDLKTAFKDAHQIILDEIKQGRIEESSEEAEGSENDE